MTLIAPSRRGFLAGMLAFAAAPAIVRASSLMAISPVKVVAAPLPDMWRVFAEDGNGKVIYEEFGSAADFGRIGETIAKINGSNIGFARAGFHDDGSGVYNASLSDIFDCAPAPKSIYRTPAVVAFEAKEREIAREDAANLAAYGVSA